MTLRQLGLDNDEGCVAPGLHRKIIEVNADGKTLVPGESGALVVLTAAAATVLVLPPPVKGMRFEIVCSITNTGDHTIETDGAATFFGGSLHTGAEGLAGEVHIADGTSDVLVTMNGTTKGGITGSKLSVEAISATVWMLEGTLIGSGTLVTPIS